MKAYQVMYNPQGKCNSIKADSSMRSQISTLAALIFLCHSFSAGVGSPLRWLEVVDIVRFNGREEDATDISGGPSGETWPAFHTIPKFSLMLLSSCRRRSMSWLRLFTKFSRFISEPFPFLGIYWTKNKNK